MTEIKKWLQLAEWCDSIHDDIRPDFMSSHQRVKRGALKVDWEEVQAKAWSLVIPTDSFTRIVDAVPSNLNYRQLGIWLRRIVKGEKDGTVSVGQDPELLTPEEAAELLRIPTIKSFYSAVERGQVPGVVRIGRKILVRAVDLRKHLGLSTTPSNDSGSRAGL